MTFANTASAVGIGLREGAIGTVVAMTVSSTREANIRERGSTSAQADAAEIVLGIKPRDNAAEARFSQTVHRAYGTSWGAAEGAS